MNTLLVELLYYDVLSTYDLRSTCVSIIICLFDVNIVENYLSSLSII